MVADLESIAEWSSWMSFVDATLQAPLEPEVYMARTGESGPVVYIGMAGERQGRGVRGRLRVYATGKAAVSGLGEAAFNRALVDPAWVRAQLERLESGHARTAQQWARAALDYWNLYFRWATTPDGAAARALEARAMAVADTTHLWNVRGISHQSR